MSYETYGFFQKEFLNHRKGTLIESDEHFLNIYDFWVLKHAFFFFFFFFLILKITEEDKAFDQTKYLNEKEQSFTNLESWKMTFEE